METIDSMQGFVLTENLPWDGCQENLTLNKI